MKILAIDPGNEQSAYMLYDGKPIEFAIASNQTVLELLCYKKLPVDSLAIEMVASYGMPVGRTVFETCVWIGRFIQAWDRPWRYIYRKDVKMHLCNSMKAKDSNIMAALIDRYGGDRRTAVGVKKKPGPLYGVSKDIWSALAIAVTASATIGTVAESGQEAA